MQKQEMINDMIHLFPYDKVKQGEDIILYGFGKVGKSYYRQIQANGYCNIKFIVDQNWEKYRSSEYPVKAPECLRDEKETETKIIIALVNRSIEIMKLLSLYGINDNRIIHRDVFWGNPVNIGESQIVKTLRMSREEAMEYYGENVFDKMMRIRKLLEIGGVDRNFVRIGADNDGGYVMVDDFEDLDEKIAYSFGINNDVSWDSDMADRGYDIYMYDHTIECLPTERNRFHFFKKGITNSTNYNADLDTLESYIVANGHQNKEHMILKMDVEGAEWGFLQMVSLETLSRFDQMVFEMHFLLDGAKYKVIEAALEKLCQSHMFAHVHANNYGSVSYIDGIAYPDTIEVTLVKRGSYNVIPHEVVLPSSLDRPCWREMSEISLGKWNI